MAFKVLLVISFNYIKELATTSVLYTPLYEHTCNDRDEANSNYLRVQSPSHNKANKLTLSVKWTWSKFHLVTYYYLPSTPVPSTLVLIEVSSHYKHKNV